MVHNGIEYGIMAAYAEGLGILHEANIGKGQSEIDAETTPLRDPEHYQYDLNLPDVAEVWRRGSVIASWLLDLTADALVKDPALAGFAGRVSDSGEGRWTIKAAIDEGVPVPVLTTALYERFTSRGEADFQDKLLSAMRFAFGGHLENPRNKNDSRYLSQLGFKTSANDFSDHTSDDGSGHEFGEPMDGHRDAEADVEPHTMKAKKNQMPCFRIEHDQDDRHGKSDGGCALTANPRKMPPLSQAELKTVAGVSQRIVARRRHPEASEWRREASVVHTV